MRAKEKSNVTKKKVLFFFLCHSGLGPESHLYRLCALSCHSGGTKEVSDEESRFCHSEGSVATDFSDFKGS